MGSGATSLDFMDAPAYERYAALSSETFPRPSERTGIPFEPLAVIREAIGLEEPSPDDRLVTTSSRSSPSSSSRSSTAFGPSHRTPPPGGWRGDPADRREGGRVVVRRGHASRGGLGRGLERSGLRDVRESEHAAGRTDRARDVPPPAGTGLDRQHDQWFRGDLENAGLHSRLERPPAICFLDITGYTRLTQDAATTRPPTCREVGPLVERSSVRHGGEPMKWLGDGVMFHFRDPGRAFARRWRWSTAWRGPGSRRPTSASIPAR